MSDDADVIEINVEARESRKVKFRIAGTVYHFNVPKLYGLLDTVKAAQGGKGGGEAEVAVFAKIESWLFDALDDEQSDELRARLLDEDDEVDIEHLVAVFQELTKAASSRPSGSRRSGS